VGPVSPFARRVDGVDDALAFGRALLGERPRTLAELRRAFAERWPDRDAEALAYAVRYLVPIVQIPPRGVWGRTRQSTWATVADWLGAEPAADGAPEETLRRYLAGFGPATEADLGYWAGLPLRDARAGLAAIADELEHHDGGLVDLRQRADAADRLPPKLLPLWDDLLVGWKDKTWLGDGGRVFAGGVIGPAATRAGRVVGKWSARAGKVTVEPFEGSARGFAAEIADVERFLASRPG
jgi:hypothetical protein